MTVIRENFESSDNFKDYVKSMSESFTVSPAFYILGGIEKDEGVVIEKNAGNTVREFTRLDNKKGDWFVVQTNSDRDSKVMNNSNERKLIGE